MNDQILYESITDMKKYIIDLTKELHIEETYGLVGNELELIALIRHCPWLYNRQLRADKLEVTWMAIADVMNASVTECQSRWRHLRESYAKAKKNAEHGIQDSFHFEFYGDMEFLRPYVKHRTRKSCFEKQIDIEQSKRNRCSGTSFRASRIIDESKKSMDLSLINLVRINPIVYNHFVDGFRTSKKDETWKNIAKELNCTVKECQLRWKTLRERYWVERKSPNQLRKWEYYDQMSFIEKFIKPRRLRKKLHSESDETIERKESPTFNNSQLPKSSNDRLMSDAQQVFVPKLETTDTSFTDTTDPLSMSPRSETTDNESGYSRNSDPFIQVPIRSLAKVQQNIADDNEFAHTIVSELKRIKDYTKKTQLKAAIFKLLCEADNDSE